MPGPCRFPDGHRRWSIGRIYVSSEDSARNGNRNWGLDKRVASFRVERTRYGESVTVRYQDRDIAGLNLKRRGPALPVLGPWLPERWRRLGQVRDNQQFVFALGAGPPGRCQPERCLGQREGFPAVAVRTRTRLSVPAGLPPRLPRSGYPIPVLNLTVTGSITRLSLRDSRPAHALC